MMSEWDNTRIVEVLLIEDQPSHAALMVEALKEDKANRHVHVVSDGLEAIEFLRRRWRHADVSCPGLILVDLDVSKRTDYDLLAEVKRNDDLKSIPVVALTSSDAEADAVRSYQLHANCYVIKPGGAEPLKAVIQAIGCFWLNSVKLPLVAGVAHEGDGT